MDTTIMYEFYLVIIFGIIYTILYIIEARKDKDTIKNIIIVDIFSIITFILMIMYKQNELLMIFVIGYTTTMMFGLFNYKNNKAKEQK